MNIFITGEKGLIAKNIIKEAKKNFSDINIITGNVDYLNMHKPGEPCVYKNSIDQKSVINLSSSPIPIH